MIFKLNVIFFMICFFFFRKTQSVKNLFGQSIDDTAMDSWLLRSDLIATLRIGKRKENDFCY